MSDFSRCGVPKFRGCVRDGVAIPVEQVDLDIVREGPNDRPTHAKHLQCRETCRQWNAQSQHWDTRTEYEVTANVDWEGVVVDGNG